MSGTSRRVHRVEGEKWSLHDLKGRTIHSIEKADHVLTITFARGVKLIVRTDPRNNPLALAVSHEKMVKQEVEHPLNTK